MMGVDCERAARELDAAGADVIGANCGNGIEQMITITKELRKHTKKPILIHANAGLPVLVGGKTTFKQTPEDMAAKVKELVDAGASIVGGCCGTTPAHISAIKKEIDKLRG
jgi:5-methyltetrahydrofolate--homocysteine methyltransferase